MRTFAELLTEYIERAGISDSELARSIGVRRQTLFRWKDGQIQRPRYREDVLRCARRLRLTPEERDLLLTAAGFSPETPPLAVREQPPELVTEAPPEDAAAKEELQKAALQPTVTSSRRPWVIGFAGGLVIVVGIALATAMLSNGEDPIPVAENIATPTQTPVPTVTSATPTAVVETPVAETPEAKLATKAVATPTPEVEEDVVVIARFVNYIGGEMGYNVAGRIRAALEEEIRDEFLPSIEIKVLTEDVRDEAEAQEVAQRTNASIVIWGEYDSGRAQARFTVPALHGSMEESQVERPVLNPTDLTATINTELPHDVRLLALLIFAELYESGEDSKKARDALDEALTTLPKESDTVATIYFRLGYLHQVKEPPNLAAAEKYYTLAILYDPRSPTPYFNRGLVYRARDDIDKAIDDYTESLFRNPRDPAVLRSRGIAYYERKRQGDAVRAVDDLSKAIAIDDTLAANYYYRGFAYYEMGERFHEDALADTRRAHELDHDNPEYSRAMCVILASTQQVESAIPHCDVAVDRGAEWAHLTRGTVYIRLGEQHDEQAITDFHHVLTIDSEHTGALNNLCWLMSLAGRAKEGLPYCERAISIDPDYHLAYDSRGLAYAMQGDYEKAIKDFNRFLEWLGTQSSDTYERYGPRRERWMKSLSKGENPFDEAELLALRNE
ncbi:MAG: tetratricopeptide repeat protein [Dehalococcoidia bacterium]|nr:tetratricopeptide repeat protein [Dehalococcoidia bacterium]